MNNDVILVVDFGTSKVRGNIISIENGDLLATSSRSYPMIEPQFGYAEVSAKLLFENAQRCVGEVWNPNKYHVKAISFSFFGDNIIFVDKNGEPLTDFIISYDKRSAKETKEIVDKVSQDTILTKCGVAYGPTIAGNILWFKNNCPDLYAKCAGIHSCQGYVLSKLGLKPLNDYSLASRKFTFDIRTREWDEELMAITGTTREMLGEIVDDFTVVGKITHFGDVQLGEEVPVVVGSFDCAAGILAGGAIPSNHNIISDVTGTYDHLGFIVGEINNYKKELKDVKKTMSVPGQWRNASVGIGAVASSGATIDWFIRQFMNGDFKNGYDHIWGAVDFEHPGYLKVNPKLWAYWGSIGGIGISTTKEDIFKSLVEALTYEMRLVLESHIKAKGTVDTKVVLGGGAAKSPKWTQLRADIANVPFEVLRNTEVSSLGAAEVAAVAIGAYDSIEEAIAHMSVVKDVYVPRKEIHELYEEDFKRYIGG